jgi:predicted Zn-dependent protease
MNETRRSPMLRWGFILILFLGGCSILGIGKKKLWIPKSKEVTIGRHAVREIEREIRLYEDEFVLKYIEGVAGKIIKVSQGRFPYKFKVFISEEKTSYSLPGGFIYISTGLLKSIESESELAAILAEEIAHVALRHGAKALTREFGYDLLMELKFKGRMSQTEKNIVESAIWMGKWGYGREAVLEADYKALDYLKDAGYNPLALIRVIKQLDKPERIPTLSLSHLMENSPSIKERVDRINSKIENFDVSILNLPFYEEEYKVIKLKFFGG